LREFEALLFTEPGALAEAVRQPELAERFKAIRDDFDSPEDIDDRPETAPSAQIRAVYGGYQNVFHGMLAAQATSLGRIRSECRHFDAWVTRLELLAE